MCKAINIMEALCACCAEHWAWVNKRCRSGRWLGGAVHAEFATRERDTLVQAPKQAEACAVI